MIPKGAAPTAEGTLAQSPLLHLLVYLLDKALTGTVVLTAPNRVVSAVHFHEGTPVKARGPDGSVPADMAGLERTLLSLCALPAETRYGFYKDKNFLASMGRAEPVTCAPLAVIMAGARQTVGAPQVDATLQRIAGRPIGLATGAAPERFRLLPEERALLERLRARRQTLDELSKSSGVPERMVRSVIYAMTITRHLDLGVPSKPPVGIPPSAPDASAGRISQPGPRPNDQTYPFMAPPMSTPPGPPSPRPGSSGQTLPPSRSSSPGQTLPPSRSSSPGHSLLPPRAGEATLPPAGPVSERRRAEIEAKLGSIEREDHFQVLGVGREATSAEVRTAYFKLALVFHPDKLPRELNDLKPRVAGLFARVNAAYETLSDDARRAEYVLSLSRPAAAAREDEQDKVARVMTAVQDAKKAEILMRSDLAGAELLARRAAEGDPEDPAHRTLLVWIKAQRRGTPPPLEEGKTSPFYDDLIVELDAVLQKEPSYERALYYRGELFKRSGRADRALRDFTKAAELNPQNIDAVREVRLHEMRTRGKKGGGGRGDEGSGGLLGKLFKR
ncbi:J domain-containing protein [Polyangium aurulentum]|uniref:J domain-containing protein n=1 Tax=Polyangium aurulentum TaxID=2567896 RepID=UPI0010AED179|nr:J domain-containing protein [Polyangium aurulentum]UQA59519.1 DnaJ domain-containing protein [Polyangium aurulentum]